jgi:hypothetical protein
MKASYAGEEIYELESHGCTLSPATDKARNWGEATRKEIKKSLRDRRSFPKGRVAGTLEKHMDTKALGGTPPIEKPDFSLT